ncbi:MAG: DEAD/DEAH box helicase [Phycisphaeraceae bacterium]|nr:DEAD/DEAH box helicase [Phycisphaeraceae bacterium]
MLVLHANWHADRLHLWMESLDAAREAIAAPPRQGGGVATTAVHPFAVAADRVRAALLDHGLSIEADPEPGTLALLLPHLGDELPAASDRLAAYLDQDLEGDLDLRLESTTVPALTLAPLAALRTLSDLHSFQGGERLVLGHELRFWMAVARFVVELVSDQRVVPTVTPVGEHGMVGAWRPWLHDSDMAERAAALAAGMPAIARAVEECDRADGAALLESAMGTLTDSIIREALIAEQYIEAIDGVDRTADPHAAWLASLLDRESRIDDPAGEGRLLRLSRQWLHQLDDPGEERSLRLLLELHEPESALADGGAEAVAWRLSFSLISMDSPPSVMPAEEIWHDASGRAGTRRAAAAEPLSEMLLTELGRVSRLYPKLEEALASGEPSGLDLETNEAYTFLREMMPLLEESGIKVLAPEWWGQPTSRLGARLLIESEDLPDEALRLTDAQASRFGLSSLVRYSWQIAVGDQPLTMEAFQSLTRSGAPLVRIAGRWVEIRREDLEGGLRFLRENPGGEVSLLDALRLAHGASSIGGDGTGRGGGLHVLGLDARGWVAEIFGPVDATDRLKSLPQPTRFQGQLRPYQLAGLSWMAFLDRFGLGACLADDMGLGKTIQLISLLQMERERAAEGERVGPTLIVAPMSVLGNWHRELTRFAPELVVHVHHGLDRPQGEDFERIAARTDVVITTYALVTRDRETLATIEWRRVALDEAQHIKNPPTKQTAAIRSLKARHRIALTGTPVENRLSELWSIMEFCAPGYLGAANDFQRRFAVPIERHRDRERAERLKQLVRPFILRRLKTDPKVITDLPSLVESRQHVPLTSEQATLYDAVVEDMLKRVDRAEGIRRRGLVLSALVKLKQICNHPAHYLREGIAAKDDADEIGSEGIAVDDEALAGGAAVPASPEASGRNASTPRSAADAPAAPVAPSEGHEAGNGLVTNGAVVRGALPMSARSGKSTRLVQMLDELLAAGDRALIFTQYRQMGHLLVSMIRRELDTEALFLHGGTPQGRRDQLVDRFQSGDPACPIFVLSLKAGGVGLNLTAANHVFHYDRWWNPAVENQATDRAFRIGQMRSVNVHKMISSGTLEERIDQMIEQKTELAAQIIGSGEAWLTELSTGQLRDLLSLRHGALEIGA